MKKGGEIESKRNQSNISSVHNKQEFQSQKSSVAIGQSSRVSQGIMTDMQEVQYLILNRKDENGMYSI